MPNNEKLCPVKTMKNFLRTGNEIALSEKKHRLDFIWMNENFTLLSTMKFQKIIYSADPRAFIITTEIHSIQAKTASTLEVRDFKLI